jgi:putative tricarboxylic transport membrane protein
MRAGQLGVAAGFALLGVVLITGTADVKPVAHIQYGPALFPTIIGWLMIALASLAAFDALRQPAAAKPEPAADEPPPAPPNYLLFAGFILAPIVYVLVADALGFLLTMALLVAVLVWLASGRPVAAIVFGFGLALVLHLIFYQVLRVTLPWGVLTSFAGVLTWR